VQIWIPDTRNIGFANECRHQSLTLQIDSQETDILNWPEASAELGMASAGMQEGQHRREQLPRRGDIVTIIMQDTYTNPHPALIIQSDLFSVHPSVTILPVTSDLRSTPLFRILINPDEGNGLLKPSEVMVDKIQTVPQKKLGKVFGHMAEEDMLAINRTLAVFLGVI
jgi:mRNA interferase MazF